MARPEATFLISIGDLPEAMSDDEAGEWVEAVLAAAANIAGAGVHHVMVMTGYQPDEVGS